MENLYESDFRTADEYFNFGRVEATANSRDVHWQSRSSYVKPVGVDPFLQETPYQQGIRYLTGFAAQV